MKTVESTKPNIIQFFDDRIIFNDNAKKLRFLRVAAVICWFVFSIINGFRFFDNPTLPYFFMSVLALFGFSFLGYSLLKETTVVSIPLTQISKVVIKNLPSNKLYGRVVTKNKKFRPFTISEMEVPQNEIVAYFRKNNILVQEG